MNGAPRDIGLPKVIEMLVTGQLSGQDEVDLGDGFHAIARIAMLSRYLAPNTATTKRVEGPGIPDFVGEVSSPGLTEALAWIARRRETGVLFAEQGAVDKPRTELYFTEGRLMLATSSEPSTLLGEQLVSLGVIDRPELDLAVLVMHRYNGQLGDTLIALGLAEPLEVFQAIKSQGRDRVAALFQWPGGQTTFYRGVEPARNDFRLDLDVPGLLLHALGRSESDDAIGARWREREHETWAAVRPLPDWTRNQPWPAPILKTLKALGSGRTVGDLVGAVVGAAQTTTGTRSLCAADVLRALVVADALGLAVLVRA